MPVSKIFSPNTKIKSADVNTDFDDIINAGLLINASINAAAAIALSKLATGALPTGITIASANIVDDSIVNADINSAAAIAQSKLANTVLAYTEITSNVTAPSSNLETKVDITGLSIAPVFPGGRNVLITGMVRLYNQSAADHLSVYVFEGVTQYAWATIYGAAANNAITLIVQKYFATPASSTPTINLKMSTRGGTGGINCEAGATYPAFIMAQLV